MIKRAVGGILAKLGLHPDCEACKRQYEKRSRENFLREEQAWRRVQAYQEGTMRLAEEKKEVERERDTLKVEVEFWKMKMAAEMMRSEPEVKP